MDREHASTAHRVATTKQTAGEGFAFEDKVVGYFLVWMLAGTAPLRVPGRIERLDCQVAADGWCYFDDLLLTLSDSGTHYRCAFSVKSNLQFTESSAPKDLVEAAWSLLLHRHSSVLNPQTDRLGLICVPHPEPTRIAIQSLLIKARRQTPKELATRLDVGGYASQTERRIHNSCVCSSNFVQEMSEEDGHAGRILQRMCVVELDFESAESASESTALFVCSELVADGTSAAAHNLWDGICQIANRIRTSGGRITREALLSEVRSVVELRALPDYAEDWHRLDSWRDIELAAIPERIAGQISIDRDDETSMVVNGLQGACIVGVVGASGSGKTVVAKRVAEEYRANGSVLWLKGERIRPGYIEGLASVQQLRHPLQEVLANRRASSGLVVLDRGERLLSEDHFAEVSLLLRVLGMERDGSAWKLLIVCREEAWSRVQNSLCRAVGPSVEWETVRLKPPDFGVLKPVWDAFPALASLAVRPHLKQILQNLKVLDLLARALLKGRRIDTRGWVGESELVKWYWQAVVREGADGLRRDVLLRRLAADFADNGRFEALETGLKGDELALVASSSELLMTDSERGTVLFRHDLLADWARLHVLISQESSLVAYTEVRAANPHWHTAFRLYGILLLESDGTGERWKDAVASCAMIRNQLIESLVFAGNARGLLNKAWTLLTADNGALLKAFLHRFQHAASLPNPQYMKVAEQVGMTAEEARTWERIPLWMYWVGVLGVLAEHVDDLVIIASIETARLARSWLRSTPGTWPGRESAAELALAVARQTIRDGPHYHRGDAAGRLPYQALLEAYSERPEFVRALLLKAAARTRPTAEDGELYREYTPPGTETHVRSAILFEKRIAQEPWPDGPLYRVDDAFRATCFETDALRGLMIHAPELAQEIILALLIEPRPPKTEPEDQHRYILPEASVGLEHDHTFYPRFYTRGPFLLFFRVNPQAAIALLVRLIDFATERWMESHHNKDVGGGMDLPWQGGMKRFVGDFKVYHWYHGVADSQVLASALMALEKWLYDCLDSKTPVDRWITCLLEKSKSMAILGVLCELGRYSPALFGGVLRPLIIVPDTYYLEALFVGGGHHHFGTPASLQEGEWFMKLARSWDSMLHRRRKLLDIAVHLFHSHAETHDALAAARTHWASRIQDGDARWSRYTRQLIAAFDEKNWRPIKLPDGSEGLEYKVPDELKTPPEVVASNEKQMLFLTLPGTCRQMIADGRAMPPNQVAAFLERSKNLYGCEAEDAETAEIAPSANGLLGTVAVLFLLHREWLKATPKEEEWCIRMLNEVLAHPPKASPFDRPDSLTDDNWEHFACEVAPIIWAEQPTDRGARERVGWLALAKHYKAAGILLSRAFQRREALGQGFWQLANLMMDWAVQRFQLPEGRAEESPVDLERWARDAVGRFVAGAYSADDQQWGTRSLKDGKLWAPNNHPQYRGQEDVDLFVRMRAIDDEQVQGAFNGIFYPSQAATEIERGRFLKFWDEALLTCLSGTRYYDEKGREIPSELVEAGIPYKYDQWVLEQLAAIVGQMRSEENPGRYWKPILALGAGAEHWVEDFLARWFIGDTRVKDPNAFVREWRRMVDFCLDAKAWQSKNEWGNFRYSALWMRLLGLPRFAMSLWGEEDSSMLGGMATYFAKVVPHVFRTAHSAVHFLSWLTHASAKELRLPLFGSVAEAALKASDRWWSEERLSSEMSRYLSQLWLEHSGHLDSVREDRKLLFGVVHRAAGTQDPLAMELQARIANRG